MTACTEHTVASDDGTPLHVRVWETDDAKATLALVHGFGEHGGRYGTLADYLTGRGIRVVAADLHGHGRSGGKRGVVRSYDDFRADLAALLGLARERHADTDGPLVLFGHSMGGGIVLDHGLRSDPGVNGIIASAPLVALAEPVPGPLEGIVRLVSRLLPNGAMKQPLDGTKISTLPEEQQAYVEDPLTHGQMGLRTAVELVDTGRAMSANAGRWSVPALIYHSEQDQLTDFAASRDFAQAAGAEFVAFADVEHEMHNDTSRDAVHALIGDFIDRLRGSPHKNQEQD